MNRQDQHGKGTFVNRFDLTDRVAVVTGGNGGIGFGIAAALGAAGARVAVWARNEAKTEGAVAHLIELGIDAGGFSCDVASEDEVERATAQTVDRMGRLDICVANAGAPGHGGFLDTTLESWNRSIATNLTGTFLCFRETARRMVNGDEGGALIAVSSVAGHHAAPRMVGYGASKAGLGGLVRSVAVELAPVGIRCNLLVPGFTENERLHPDTVTTDIDTEIVASIPAGRWGTPDDIGAAAVYLADPSLPYHTGAELFVDGAYSIMPPYLAVRAARTRLTGEK